MTHLRARLDLCKANAERAAVLKELVSAAESWQKPAIEAAEAGTGDAADVLRAKATLIRTGWDYISMRPIQSIGSMNLQATASLNDCDSLAHRGRIFCRDGNWNMSDSR